MVKKGFTLAEVLITLGVIGIVATITIPNLIGNYAKKQQVAQLQRSVNALSVAATTYLADNDEDTLEATNFADDRENFVQNYLKGSYATRVADVFPNKYQGYLSYGEYSISDATSSFLSNWSLSNEDICGKLKTGAAICIGRTANDDGKRIVVIDVNGDANPNVFGRDVFGVILNADGSIGSPGGDVIGGGEYKGEYYAFRNIMNAGWVMNY